MRCEYCDEQEAITLNLCEDCYKVMLEEEGVD